MAKNAPFKVWHGVLTAVFVFGLVAGITFSLNGALAATAPTTLSLPADSSTRTTIESGGTDFGSGINLGQNAPSTTPGSPSQPVPKFSGINIPWIVNETGPVQVPDDAVFYGLTEMKGALNVIKETTATREYPAEQCDMAGQNGCPADGWYHIKITTTTRDGTRITPNMLTTSSTETDEYGNTITSSGVVIKPDGSVTATSYSGKPAPSVYGTFGGSGTISTNQNILASGVIVADGAIATKGGLAVIGESVFIGTSTIRGKLNVTGPSILNGALQALQVKAGSVTATGIITSTSGNITATNGNITAKKIGAYYLLTKFKDDIAQNSTAYVEVTCGSGDINISCNGSFINNTNPNDTNIIDRSFTDGKSCSVHGKKTASSASNRNTLGASAICFNPDGSTPTGYIGTLTNL